MIFVNENNNFFYITYLAKFFSSISDDLEDIKLIKKSINSKIKFDFIHLDKKDLDILKKNLIIE